MPKTIKFDIPGVKSIGQYIPNTEYTLDDAEADRLIRDKGFVEVMDKAIRAPKQPVVDTAPKS